MDPVSSPPAGSGTALETFHRYVELPAEIRHQIIYEALSGYYNISDTLKIYTSIHEKKCLILTRTYFPTEIAPLLLASRTIRADTLEVLARTPIKMYHRPYTLLFYL
jgi:hypothetical protein